MQKCFDVVGSRESTGEERLQPLRPLSCVDVVSHLLVSGGVSITRASPLGILFLHSQVPLLAPRTKQDAVAILFPRKTKVSAGPVFLDPFLSSLAHREPWPSHE